MAGRPRRKPPPPAPTGIIAARVRGALSRLTGRSAPRRARRSGRSHRPRARRRALGPSAARRRLRRAAEPGQPCRGRRRAASLSRDRSSPPPPPPPDRLPPPARGLSSQPPQAPPPARRPTRGQPPPPIGPAGLGAGLGAGHPSPALPTSLPAAARYERALARPRSRGRAGEGRPRCGSRAAAPPRVTACGLQAARGRDSGLPKTLGMGKRRRKEGRTRPGHQSESLHGRDSNP